MYNNQKGGSFIGMIIVIAAIVFLGMLGLKVGPAYLEFMNVKNALKRAASSADVTSKKAVADAFEKSARVDNITVVKGSDLVVNNGVVSVEYQVVVPIVANASALLDFHATSAK
ncbi:DUF4845 domain-containing protein [Methylotenera versatilis]|uniref:DUF4845 domain-containing protein n=1 Tax=Methylotenera versatilis TaxID=1055487 RepID=UPI0006455AE3|nr:DUF4845 domain-containing protein [Methylotenera versatilis]